uniref:GDA1/CD39 (Nucleoside phosphatase) family protein n=1 Tax=Chromera velia CCMP2878 TaxID=1169474 RepID=A0A0G4FG53_9ALVE|eukprot:Cvel_16666.t1-p1 / transcript=Cvel_16666.t1 / gene=Cvel_16666 / organism=Chromera_velia_CCMP2878 / gene_product=Probable apyrase 6, putative / transcript_product=Probable apyrase 6, putative / location=Cvel_scaffold1293:17637-20370(+) / protein_length=715 / sequence_SO=supercontig / SO=protein_coding / is_pseudo=false
MKAKRFWILVCSLCNTAQGSAAAVLHNRYAAVIDAGSTGTRLHVFAYHWNPALCEGHGAVEVAVPDKNKKVYPGLSSFTQKVSEVPDYLDRLRVFLDGEVPKGMRASTPLFFRATAGIRNLPRTVAKRILQSVQESLQSWGYLFETSWARVMGGKEEGVLGWLVLNELLGTFPHESLLVGGGGSSVDPDLEGKRQRASLFEVGGASAQVVVELSSLSAPAQVRSDSALEKEGSGQSPANGRGEDNFGERTSRTPPVSANRLLRFCGREYHLHAFSFLGLGRQLSLENLILREAAAVLDPFSPPQKRRRREQDRQKDRETEKEGLSAVPVACLQRGASMVVGHSEVSDAPSRAPPVPASVEPPGFLTAVPLPVEKEKGASASSPSTPCERSALWCNFPGTEEERILVEGDGDGEGLEDGDAETESFDSTQGGEGMRVWGPGSGVSPRGQSGLRANESASNAMSTTSKSLVVVRTVEAFGTGKLDSCLNSVASNVLDYLPPLPPEVRRRLAEAPLYCTENCHWENVKTRGGEAGGVLSSADLREAARAVCGLHVNAVKAKLGSAAEEERSRTACFGLSLFAETFTGLLGLPPDFQATAANSVGEADLGWAAGVLLLSVPELFRSGVLSLNETDFEAVTEKQSIPLLPATEKISEAAPASFGAFANSSSSSSASHIYSSPPRWEDLEGVGERGDEKEKEGDLDRERQQAVPLPLAVIS